MRATFPLRPSVLLDPRPAIVLAAALGLVVATALPWGSPTRRGFEADGFTVVPQGDRVPRLAPVKVTFKKPPAERDGARLLTLEPAAKGDYAWVNDRTLLFQPAFPGLLRGWPYTVNVSAAPEAGLDLPYTARFTTDGALTVQTVIPAPQDVEVPRNAQIMVQFSRSVAPLTLLSEQSTKPVIEFDPPLPGMGEWLNTSLYRFTPDALPAYTTIRARIKAGLSSLADGVLKEDYVWIFTTYSPALESVFPDDRTTFASLRQKVVLRFNQPMDKALVAARVRVNDPDGNPVAGSFTWTERDTVATFTPAGALARATKYEVVVPKGLRSASGGEGPLTGRVTSFTTVGEARVESTIPASGSTNAERYGISIVFATPMNTASLEGRISVSGIDMAKVNLDWNPDRRTLRLNTPLRPSTPYSVRIAAGATDRDGQTLPAHAFSFTTGALQPFVSLAVPNWIATYSAATEPLLYFQATNVTQATFTLYPLTREERDQILSRNQFPNAPTIWTPSSPAIRTWVEPIRGAANEVLVGKTSLTGSGRPLPKGDYLVRSGRGGYGSDLAFVVVDTAVVTKLSNDELLAWVLDLDSGQPLGGVSVNASGPGIEAASATRVTDQSGLVSFPLPNIAANTDLVRPQRSYVLTVDEGGRKGVASTFWVQGTQPYQLGLPMHYPQPYVGHVYSDRPIYRPGEQVFYKGVVRADDDAAYRIPSGELRADAVIRDPQGKELSREKVTLNEFGTFGASLRLPDSAAIGDYRIELQEQLGSQQRYLAGTSFNVAEFRRPEFGVEVQTDRVSYVTGERIPTTATATFFFGGALEGAATEWSVQSSPYRLSVKGYERYSFTDYDYFPRPSVTNNPLRAQGQSTTRADGRAVFAVPAVIQGDEGAQTYTISAKVTDQNAQAVAGSANVTVHRADLYAGIRPAQYLAEIGKEARIDLVSVDTSGKILPGRRIAVRFYERTWITTKEETAAGGRRYRSEPVDQLLATLGTTTRDNGEGSVTYRPTKAGTLRIVAEVTDAGGRTSRSAAYLWVAGEGYASWRVTNDDTVQLVADKDAYEVGDVAEVLVPAPFEGAVGLVTVERGKIRSRTTRTFATNSERLRIPVVDPDVPNAFVSVVLYRPPTSADPIPRYKVGYVQLPVSTKTRQLNVSIRSDREQAKPGDRVKYDLRVTDSAGKGVRAELSVDVVDKAVLSLAEERSVSGLRAFWFERGLSVSTASSLSVSIDRSNDVIADARTGGKGGGTGSGSERLRQAFRNSAFWQAQLVTNEDGTASVEVPMPDNLTTWRMRARALSGDTMVGEGTNELLSTQPLLLRPALPRFLRVGDKATIRLLVRNGTRNETDLKVSLAAAGIDVSGNTDRAGTIGPNASTLFEWPASVSTSGSAKLTFRANTSDGLGDAVEQQIPVALDVTPETTATGGVVDNDPLSEAIYLPTYAIRSSGGLQVAVKPSLSGSMRSELDAFARRPWEGYEDTVKVASRVLATIGVRRADRTAGRHVPLDEQIQADIATIVSRQNPDGGWSWCALSFCPSDPEVTGWVLIALGEARREGKSVDASTLGGASTWVSRYINRLTDVESPADVNQKAFLLTASTIAGPGNYLSQMRAMVEQYGTKLANFGRAYLLVGLAQSGQKKADSYVSRLLNDLASNAIASANGNHWEDDPYRGSTHTNTRATGLVLEALVRLDPTHPLIAETVRWLMVARAARGWETMTERSQAVLALSEFAAKTGELAGDYNYSVRLGERDLLTGRFKAGDGRTADGKMVPLAELESGKVTILGLSKDVARPGRMYYSVDLRYVTPAQGVEALNRGVAVTHEYTALDDPKTRIDRAKLGDTVRVKLTVVAPSDLNYVVVEDFLPAGLEPIDPRLRTTDAGLKARLDQERQRMNRPNTVDYWAPWFHWYYSPWQQSEIRDDRVMLKAQRLPKGIHEFVYYARATSAGSYFVAPAHAEESFFPEVFGRSDSGRFVIEP